MCRLDASPFHILISSSDGHPVATKPVLKKVWHEFHAVTYQDALPHIISGRRIWYQLRPSVSQFPTSAMLLLAIVGNHKTRNVRKT
jgi:hypothetical protein